MTLYEKMTGGVYTIAEMSANHAGKKENALEIVRRAKQAGADCLKIQTYTADTITIDCDNEYFRIHGGLWDGYKLYDLYGDAGTPWEWQAEIKEECDRVGIDFLSTPFDRTAVDFLESISCPAYKIASFELVDIPLIEYAASKGKPMIISCGMGSVEEIRDAVDACRRANNFKVVLLKCCSEYPASYDDMRLANIPDMKERFGVPVGLSDHSMGSLAAVVGVSLGACVVEKHVCLSRKMKNPDSEFSMEMDEFERLVRDIRDAKRICGGVSYELTKGERASTVFRRSLFAVKDIKKGECFTADNVRSIRPNNGLMPKLYGDLLGCRAKRDIPFGTPVRFSDFCNTQYVFTSADLLAREIDESDAESIVQWRKDPQVYRFFRVPRAITVEEHINWFNNSYRQNDARRDYMLFDEHTAARAGVVGLCDIDLLQHTAQINYIIAPEYRNRGYAVQAVDAVCEYAKCNFDIRTVYAEIHTENVASVSVVKKLDFTTDDASGDFVRYKKSL